MLQGNFLAARAAAPAAALSPPQGTIGAVNSLPLPDPTLGSLFSQLQEIPSSDNASVVPDNNPPNLCSIKGKVVSLSPAKWFCANPAHRVDTCAACNGVDNCLSPEAALLNLEAANASVPFKGWNPQGGGEESETQHVTLRLPGSGSFIRAILWANAGDVEHDPEWIKVWSSYDGEIFKLIDTLNVTFLKGNSELTVLPLPGNLDPTKQTRAKYWKVNPGGIQWQSIPRSVGLCSTVDCTHCGAPRQFFNWASDQPESTFSRWLVAHPPVVSYN